MANYWVAVTGNDAWPGTFAQPWLTVNKAATTAVAGDVVTFKDGTWNITGQAVWNSGTPGNFVTFKAQNRRLAIWSMSANNYLVRLDGYDYIRFEELVLEGTLTGDISAIVRIWNNNHITLDDCEIRNSQGHLVWARNAEYIEVLDCTIHGEVMGGPHHGVGIWMDGIFCDQNSTYITIDGCEVYRTTHHGITFRSCHSSTINDCYVHDTGSHGIGVGDQSGSGESNNNEITYCVTKNNGSFRLAVASKRGIYLYDGCRRLLVYRNEIVETCGPGISVRSECYGPISIHNNTLYDCNNEYSSHLDDWGTLFLNDAGAHENPTVDIRNNIFYHGQSCLTYLIESNIDTNLTLDYNLLYDSTGSEDIEYEGVTYLTYAAYQVAGFEPNSVVSSDPDFNGAGGGDFTLQPGSPAIDAGVDLGYPFVGTAPDIGAHEYTGGLSTSTTLTTSSSTSTSSTTGTTSSTSVTTTSVSTSTTTLLPAGMLFVTGSYVGDGNDNRWIPVAFEPDLVVVKADAVQHAMFRTSTMPTNRAAWFSLSDALQTNAIQDFGVTGFQIGTDTEVNSVGVTYYWAAWKDGGGDKFTVDSYTGDGNDNRWINPGFQPTIVWVKREDDDKPVWRIAENAGDDTLYFDDLVNVTDRIQSFGVGGFQIGTAAEVNDNGSTYHWAAWLDIANHTETGSYVGDGNDDRDIAVGFEPGCVFVKGDIVQQTILRIDTMDAGDSAKVNNAAPVTNQIQAFEATNFEIGTNWTVNQLNEDYYWSAWREALTVSTSTTVTTTSTSLTTTSVSTSTTTGTTSSTSVTVTSVSTSVTTTSVSTSLTTTSVSTSLSTSISTSVSTSTSTSISTTTLPHPPVSPVEEACVGQAEYQVRVRNTDGDIVAVFHGAGRGVLGGMRSLSYRKRVRTPGGWEVWIDGNDERIALLELRQEAPTRLDYVFEFWRHDPAGGLDWYEDFAGFHRSDRFTQDSEGQEVYVARGRGFNDLIAAEPIRYAKDSAEALKTGNCETVAKEYVDENIGPGAPAVRQMHNLTVEASAGTGAAWTGDKANKALYDVLIELAEAAPGDFTIEHTGPVSFEFRWRPDRWGEDKTRGNGIRPAVVFGAQRGNITNVNYSYSRLDEVNVCYVGGPARGPMRQYVTRTTGAENDSPWAQRAVFRNASNSKTTAALNDKGDETLEKQEPKRTFDFEVIQTQATRYGRDWNVGDLVTAEFRDTDFDQKIVGVYVSMGDDGIENIQPELEDS